MQGVLLITFCMADDVSNLFGSKRLGRIWTEAEADHVLANPTLRESDYGDLLLFGQG